MFVEERLNKILNTLEECGQVDVDDLAGAFHVSRETIRRDLNRLESERRLVRTHGGAIAVNGHGMKEVISSTEPPANVRAAFQSEEKKKIAKKAASMIKSGDIIFVDNSTTCAYMYPFIPGDVHITVLTNSLQFLLASTKVASPMHTIVCMGGILKLSNLSLYGNMTIKNSCEYFPNKAFISCTGIISETQLADMGVQEIEVKRALMAASREVFLLADHTKFKPSGQVYLGSMNDIDHIITDRETDFSYLSLSPENRSKIIFAD